MHINDVIEANHMAAIQAKAQTISTNNKTYLHIN